MRRVIKCERCGELKENCAKGLCKQCYERIRGYEIKTFKEMNAIRVRQYYKEHPELVTLNQLRTTTCRILDDHHEDLIDDENRLSTQYILDICTGVKPNGGKLYR